MGALLSLSEVLSLALFTGDRELTRFLAGDVERMREVTGEADLRLRAAGDRDREPPRDFLRLGDGRRNGDLELRLAGERDPRLLSGDREERRRGDRDARLPGEREPLRMGDVEKRRPGDLELLLRGDLDLESHLHGVTDLDFLHNGDRLRLLPGEVELKWRPNGERDCRRLGDRQL